MTTAIILADLAEASSLGLAYLKGVAVVAALLWWWGK